jgi:hypothetical protein
MRHLVGAIFLLPLTFWGCGEKTPPAANALAVGNARCVAVFVQLREYTKNPENKQSYDAYLKGHVVAGATFLGVERFQQEVVDAARTLRAEVDALQTQDAKLNLLKRVVDGCRAVTQESFRVIEEMAKAGQLKAN